MKINLLTETLWRRDCQDCTHAYYLPAKEKRGFLRRLFRIKKKFKEPCPICDSKNVKTTKLVTRILSKEPEQEEQNKGINNG